MEFVILKKIKKTKIIQLDSFKSKQKKTEKYKLMKTRLSGEAKRVGNINPNLAKIIIIQLNSFKFKTKLKNRLMKTRTK
jgi:N-acetylglutamate synthase/N-acetylornithine aminotransferase